MFHDKIFIRTQTTKSELGFKVLYNSKVNTINTK